MFSEEIVRAVLNAVMSNLLTISQPLTLYVFYLSRLDGIYECPLLSSKLHEAAYGGCLMQGSSYIFLCSREESHDQYICLKNFSTFLASLEELTFTSRASSRWVVPVPPLLQAAKADKIGGPISEVLLATPP